MRDRDLTTEIVITIEVAVKIFFYVKLKLVLTALVLIQLTTERHHVIPTKKSASGSNQTAKDIAGIVTTGGMTITFRSSVEIFPMLLLTRI